MGMYFIPFVCCTPLAATSFELQNLILSLGSTIERAQQQIMQRFDTACSSPFPETT